jgi:dihydrofolate reductase
MSSGARVGLYGCPVTQREEADMPKVTASITTSVDGYIAGPDDGPGKGLGEGGERLHYWVFDGPWSYGDKSKAKPSGEALEFLEEAMARTGAIVVGRWMYEAAGHWGDKNPWDVPVFVVTHRPEEQPDTGEFNFVDGFANAIARAREVAGEKDIAIGGGADVIRQGLEAGLIDELAIIVAPVILGGGKALFEGFTKSLDLEHTRARQMQWATVLEYRVGK